MCLHATLLSQPYAELCKGFMTKNKTNKQKQSKNLFTEIQAFHNYMLECNSYPMSLWFSKFRTEHVVLSVS